ncbi:DegT/DnrJ/EryC1/StrS aminotransferase [Delftia sp. HK171]|uniref:DegT/DnrJ/EryC1/StrS family aminotransferase n=1 Tax=Delftia sp. HK171 TaxID=1920191 RepID=UPI000909A2B4|nr:DegT/DnrJ/EryC1/StrS family aminotransferase [Delftia sp. HK171]APE46394.1 DegT/DnrJ/EryC1/StrS aminotransferase [Delftia sp. HK171]
MKKFPSLYMASDRIPLLLPDMPSPQALLPWLTRMHEARHYSNFGPLVQELEYEICQRLSLPREQLTTVANATLGLELVLQSLDLPSGSHVLVPALTFVATATAIVRAGHVPVLGDVDPNSWMLTPEIARLACTEMRIDVVLPVATFGMPHGMHAWQQFERDTGVPVIVDAAAAYGSQQLQGSEGTLVFSLHTTKSLPAGEGGLVVSTRPGLVSRVRQLSNFGINLDHAAGLPVGALAGTGTNAKMSEYHAAVGLASLQIWEQHAEQRHALQIALMEKLDAAGNHRLSWQKQSAGGALVAPTLLCARLPGADERAALEAACGLAHITTRRWYQPLLQHMPALRHRHVKLATPHADSLADTLLGLPFFLGMTQQQCGRIQEVVSMVLS